MKLAAIITLLLGVLAPARAAEIAIGLTDDVIEVDAGFSGAKIVLFGALSGDAGTPGEEGPLYDIVAVVRGPAGTFRMRPLQRGGVIWSPGPAIDVKAPEVLLTSATRPLEEVAPAETRRKLGIGAEAEWLVPRISPAGPEGAAFVAASGALSISRAFLEHVREQGLFIENPDAVNFKKGALFAINVELSPATPVGDYAVNVYLFREGELVSEDSATLAVNKVGLERSIYEIAHGQPLAYGVGCVIISLIAGWLAAAAFRK